ncbi:hypothetical protein Trydic_g20383 [Trypoxylus dichotomus]
MGNWLRAYKERELPENYFRIEVNILRALGIELMEEETLKYKIYSRIVLFFLVYVFTFTETLELYAQWGNLDAIVLVISYLFTHIKGVIKVTLLLYNRKKIGNILKMLHNKPFAPDSSRGGPIEEKYVRNIIKITETQLVIYFTVVSVTIVSGAIIFLKSRIFDDKSNWRYPYVPITIINTEDSPLFELVGIYEVTCVLLYAAIIATTYVLLSTILAHLSVQFKILNNAFRSIRARAKDINDLHGGDEDNENKILSQLLGKYIDHHLSVLNLAAEMEQLCNWMFLVVMLASVILLCFLLYQVSLVSVASVPFVQNFFYYWIVVCQIGMYCYWGDEATFHAASVAKAAGEVDWPGAPLHVSKALVVIIARSQKPLYVTAGKFVALSMDTFVSIIKGSFSYFMVLRQTQDE